MIDCHINQTVVTIQTSIIAKKNMENPDKYFTKDILDQIDEACQKEFLYGSAMKEVEDVGDK